MQSWRFSNFYFFYFMTVGVIVPYWSLYLQFKGFSATEIGQLMAILLITKVIAPNLWAVIADRMVASQGSALGLLRFATLATLFWYCFTYFADAFWSMGMLMLSFCVFWNACLPQLEAATLNHLEERREQYGRIRLWGSVGFIVTVLGLGAIMDELGPGAIMPTGALVLFLTFIASLSLMEPARDSQVTNPTPVALKTVLTPSVLLLLLLCVVMQLSHAPFYTFFSIYLESYAYTKLHIGWLWSIGVLFEIVIFLFGFRLMRRFRLADLLAFTFLAAAARWCLVALFPSVVTLIWFTQILHAITYGLYHSVMIQLVHRLFPPQYQVRGQALYSSVTFGLGGAIGSFSSGYVWTEFGGRWLFGVAGVLMLGVFLLSLLFIRRLTQETSR